MRLYLVRHGKAEKRSKSGRDEDRALEPRGERQSRWLGETLTRLAEGDRPALILTSPAVRARETARIIGEHLRREATEASELQLGAALEGALALIPSERASRGALMLVGHNPMMEMLLLHLAPGLDAEDAEMRTGEAAVLDLAPKGRIEGCCRLAGRMRIPD